MSPGAWALAHLRLAAAEKVDNQAAMVSLGRPGAGEQLLQSCGFLGAERLDMLFACEFADAQLYTRALASTGPAYEAIQNVGEAEFHRAAVEQAQKQLRDGLPLRAEINLAGYLARKPQAAEREPPTRPLPAAEYTGHLARVLQRVGTLGGGHHREPRHVPAVGVVPLAQLRSLLGHVAAGRARLCRPVPLAVSPGGSRRSGPAVPAQRAGVPLRSGPLHGHQGAGRACPARRHQPHLRRIPRRRWQASGGDVPDRA